MTIQADSGDAAGMPESFTGSRLADVRLVISSLALVAGNLVPLLGALWWGWEPASLLLIFWAESAIIGGFAIARFSIAFRRGRPRGMRNKQGREPQSLAGLMSFFLFHYGLFMGAHLFFLFMAFLEDTPHASVSGILALIPPLAVLGLVVSHAASFFIHYLGVGRSGDAQWRTTSVGKEFFLPYARILPMHIAIILGAMIGGAGGFQATSVAVALVLLKLVVDLGTHVAGHLIRSGAGPADLRQRPPRTRLKGVK